MRKNIQQFKKNVRQYVQQSKRSYVDKEVLAQSIKRDVKQIGRQQFQNFSQEDIPQAVSSMMSKGMIRAYDDTHKIEKARSKVHKSPPSSKKMKSVQDQLRSTSGMLYRVKRSTYLDMLQSRQKILNAQQMLQLKAITEWEAIQEFLENNVTRVILDGVMKGKAWSLIEKDITEQIDKDTKRAVGSFNDSMVKTFTEGQLEGMEELGVKEVGVQVEWATAADDRVCSMCRPLEGILVKIDQARGMLPRHPNCRCAWVPGNVGEPTKGQKTTPKQVNKQIQKSTKGDKDKQDVSWKPKPASGKPPTRNSSDSIFSSGIECTIEDLIHYGRHQ